jgi:NO-binding membrane sensor protein with MHYT domain
MEQFIESHNWLLVAVSYLVAVVGAFVSLYIADYIVDRSGKLNFGWLTLAAIVFGGCAIWAMHFIGMLAYQTAMPVTYDVKQTLASAAFPILLCFAAFWTVFKFRGNASAWLVSGLLFGLGVAAMHYVGMGAMRMEATMTHDPVVFYLSIAIAVVAATAALHIFTHWTGTLRQTSPLVMGLAVCGMHYTAMYGMRMGPMAEDMGARQFFEGAVTGSFMGFSAGLVVFLTVVVGGVLVVARKALDMEPNYAPG